MTSADQRNPAPVTSPSIQAASVSVRVRWRVGLAGMGAY